jgi:hypothetical protein
LVHVLLLLVEADFVQDVDDRIFDEGLEQTSGEMFGAGMVLNYLRSPGWHLWLGDIGRLQDPLEEIVDGSSVFVLEQLRVQLRQGFHLFLKLIN